MKIGEFICKVFSDGGEPSSSRILTFIITVFDVVILSVIFHHMFRMTDNAALGQWLGALPFIIAALVGFAATPYAINRSTCSVSDIISAVFSKR